MIRKIIRIFTLVAVASPLTFAVTKNKTFQETDFSKGLDSYHNPQSLQPGYVQDANNILFGEIAPVTKRNGYALSWSTKSYQYTGLWTYTDKSNTTWQIARSSDELIASNLSGSVVLITTVSVNNTVGETNAFGNAYFVDQSSGVYYWNGTSTTYVSGSPTGSIIVQFHNRLWVVGAPVPNGNQLYGSKYYDGNTWTTGLNATDPVQLSVGLQDNFDNITAEYVYIDTLYIFKHYSIFALYGFDQTSFQISQLTQECGCIDGGSIQTYNSGLKFLSLRGVESFNGYSCTRISDPIKNKVDPAIQVGGFSQASWVQSQQSDWQAGASSGTSASISPPYLVVSSFSVVENSSTQWTNGSTNQTTIFPSSFTLSASTITSGNTNISNNGFESGSSNWTLSNGSVSGSVSGVHCTLNPRTGSGMLLDTNTNTGDTYSVSIQTCGGSTLHSATFVEADNSCTYTSRTLSSSGLNGMSVRISVDDATSGYNVAISQCFVNSGTDITFYTASDETRSSFPQLRSIVIDDFTNGRSLTSGSFTSQTFDSGFSSASYSLASAWITSGSSPTFSLQTSSASSGPWSILETSTGTNATGNRYSKYSTTITISNTDTALTYVTSESILATANPGSFKSQIHNVGSINSWGNFNVQEALNSGAIAFSICSSTNSNMSAPVSCTNQTPNSQINSTTGTYVQWYATFTVTAATQTPTLQSGTVQWFSGSKPTPLASTVWNNRYWLSLTTNTVDTSNDSVIVLDKDNRWTSFDIHAGAFTQYKNSLYHADSRSTGNIYIDDQGTSDNGSAIDSHIRTRSFGLGDFAADDYLYAVYPSVLGGGNCTMTLAYNMDGGGAQYPLGSTSLNEFTTLSSVRLPFPVDASHQDFGQTIDFTIGTNDSQCSFLLYGIEGLFKQRPVQ